MSKSKASLKQQLIEISNTMLQIESHREHIKDVVAIAAEEHELTPADVKKLAAFYHKQNAEQIREKNDGLLDLYDSIFN